ncbi:GntR family transcriptional regulator [Lacticigenium naphthae]|uniref:GntR family transcriptional regulator n=1 Tax=Lacticigenium naphthae TaxID=515351 RepID=UPI0003F89980|nr:GntR family transcriptional regulator [Lacticigenium naphthae]
MAKYEEISNKVRERIYSGEYPIDSMIPDQNSLARAFGVSRMTIKKALDILAMEGLIYRQRGAGTFVTKTALRNERDSAVDEYDGLSTQMKGRKLVSKSIEFAVEFPTPLIQKKLMIEENEPVYKIVRQRSVDDDLLILEETYMPAKLVPGLSRKHAESSIYAYIKGELGLEFGGAFRQIHADKPKEYDLLYLNCREGDPVLEVEQVVYLKDGRPMEYSKSRNRFDTRSYNVIDIKKDN